MKVVVTGSCGFVGTHLNRRLLALGHQVIELDKQLGHDIAEWESLTEISEFDAVIHLAALSFVPDSYKRPHDFYNANYTFTLNMLELCRLNQAKMIFTSSYVYGVPHYLPIDEKHPVQAFNPYCQTKILSEELCKGYNQFFNIPVVILRPFNIYGIGQNANFLIPLIFNQALQDGKIMLKDPTPKRDLVYIDDVVDAYIKALDRDSTDCEIYNIASGSSFSVLQIAEMIANLANKPIDISFKNETRPNEIADTRADIRKATEQLLWSPKVGLKEGLAEMLHLLAQNSEKLK